MNCEKCHKSEVRTCNLTCRCNCHVVRTAPQEHVDVMWKGFDWEEMPYQ
jgi:hypothetical protein